MNISIDIRVPANSAPWCDIFNTVTFFDLYKTARSFYLSLSADGGLAGCIHFTEIEPGIFKSPYRGTYGSFDFKDGVNPETIKYCIDEVCKYLRETLKAKKIIIVSPPFAHDISKSSWLFYSLLNSGFTVDNTEINYTIPVDNLPLTEKMMRNNRKRYNKCLREGFSFEEVTTTAGIADIYAVIKHNRESKGYTVSMTLDQIMDLYRVFPENIYFFKTKQGQTDAASGICIKLNSKTLYVFYWGHMPGLEQYSPVSFLAVGIYDFARKNGFEMIDGGTSSLNGLPNYGVAAFKENLGFTASLKLTYSKTYE